MIRSRFLFLAIGLVALTCAAAVSAPLLPLLGTATETILAPLAAALVVAAGVSMIAWAVINELVGLARQEQTDPARPARFVPPQTGTPEPTAFG